MSVRRALGLYRRFTAKEPDFVTALGGHVAFPSRIGASGRVLRIWYRSDKWRSDGNTVVYVHTYDGAVDFCEAWRDGLRAIATPRWRREIVLLGDCLGVEVELDGGEVRFPALPRGTLLCATPDGRVLALVHERDGVLAVILGGEQQVTDRGIEG